MPVKFVCSSNTLAKAAERRLGFRNAWIVDERDACNVVRNLVELVADGYELGVECSVVPAQDGSIVFAIELSSAESMLGRYDPEEEFERFQKAVQAVQKAVFGY